MDHLSRFYIGSILLSLVTLSYANVYIFTTFILSTFVVSIIELLSIPKKDWNFTKLIVLVNYLWIVNVIYNLSQYKQIINIMVYNSISDAIQYIAGKTIGYHKPFHFTSKSFEGYIAGIIITQLIFNYDHYFIVLNILGMFGGIFSSIVKRNIGIKHWSTLLGPHGGINDRLDSLCAPIIFYLNFINYK